LPHPRKLIVVESEQGDLDFRIRLPPSALEDLTKSEVHFPMLFEIKSESGVKTHAGVLEFIAEEDHVIMPKSMIKRLQVGWNVEFCFQINPLTLL
jgi:ubiquitin fusion degradation protein 1